MRRRRRVLQPDPNPLRTSWAITGSSARSVAAAWASSTKQQISLGRRVALKVLPFAAIMDPRQLARFQNESHAAASLQHPHIVPVYAVGCERGVHYYAMQYIERAQPGGSHRSAAAVRVRAGRRARGRKAERGSARAWSTQRARDIREYFAAWRGWACRRPRRWTTRTARA